MKSNVKLEAPNTYYILQKGEVVGEAFVMSNDDVLYFLYKSIHISQSSTLDKMKKYKFVLKGK